MTTGESVIRGKTFFTAQTHELGHVWLAFRYTWCAAFGATLQQLAELAAQREEVADKLSSHVAADLGRFTQELKAERKSVSWRSLTRTHKRTHTHVQAQDSQTCTFFFFFFLAQAFPRWPPCPAAH